MIPISIIIERILSFCFEQRVIVNCDRDPYLLRWYVFRTEKIGLFIHKFVRSDEDRALHDHPWSFLVIPIWRGYYEHSQRPYYSLSRFDIARCDYESKHGGWTREWDAERERWIIGHQITIPKEAQVPVERRVWPLIGTRLRPATYRHRVELFRTQPDGREQPSWSLFFRFKSIRVWGFWLPEGFVAWNKWWQDKCE